MRQRRLRIPALLAVAMTGGGFGGAHAQEAAAVDPFAFFAERDTRPLATVIATDYSSSIEAGLGYVGSDSFNFGRYNGLSGEGVYADLNLDLSGRSETGWLSGLVDRWQITGRDLGLDTRQLELDFGRTRDYDVRVSFDQQLQVLNDTGRTPFRGGSTQTLPSGWVAANLTSGMTELFDVSRQFDQELERDRFRIAVDKQLGAWRVGGAFRTEQKNGRKPTGAALYADASNGHAALLPRKVDHTTTELDLSLAFAQQDLALELGYLYSDFNNADSALTWQNPYDMVFDPTTNYPEGFGRLALEPDNRMHRLRAVGSYRFTPRLRLRFDGSFARTTQNSRLLPYTVNDLSAAALPRGDFAGKVDSGTLNASLNYRPKVLPRLTLEASYRLEGRDNRSPRDGYLYVRGDVWAPEDDKFTVYNTTHDRTLQRADFEGTYQLPWRNARLSLGYGHETVERRNAAVAKTEEDIFSAKLAVRPWEQVSARLEFGFKDRAASTYRWDQSYYALLDSALINEIPDNQRYSNHPQLSQYYLSNREQRFGKLSVSYAPTERWNLQLDGSWQDTDYDASELGLTHDELGNLTLTAGYSFSTDLSASLFVSFDDYQAEQSGRAFRGGIEKNAFATEPPLPQASDPTRNWQVQPEDKTTSFGANARWVAQPDRLEMEWEYSFYDTDGSTRFTTFGAADLTGEPVPDNGSRQHRLRWITRYHLRASLSLNFEYQYYRFVSSDWALDGVGLSTLDKVLWTGQRSPSDVVQYFMITAEYRLRK